VAGLREICASRSLARTLWAHSFNEPIPKTRITTSAHSFRLLLRYEQSIGPNSLKRRRLSWMKRVLRADLGPLETKRLCLGLNGNLWIDPREAVVVFVSGICRY
jgi:hypothetical protein